MPVEQLQQNWLKIVESGVPNYFGSQRFGIDGQNVAKGMELLGGARFPRHLESIYLSSVRSYLFNLLLAERVKAGSWNALIPGDFAQFAEGKAGFYCQQPSVDDIERCAQGRLSPAGSLPAYLKIRSILWMNVRLQCWRILSRLLRRCMQKKSVATSESFVLFPSSLSLR